MKNLLVVATVSLCALFALFPTSALAIIVTGESIEWVLANSHCVVVGKVVRVDKVTGPNKKACEIATVAVSQTIKGKQTDRVHILVEVAYLRPAARKTGR